MSKFLDWSIGTLGVLAIPFLGVVLYVYSKTDWR